MAEHSHVDNVSYAYFWWRHMFDVQTPSGPQQVIVVAAQGNGGQKIYIAPEYHLVAVFTGGAYNAEGTAPNILMEKLILPKLMQAATRAQLASLQK
jgi:CubicO group peptidase (beta-lactamase class C family)